MEYVEEILKTADFSAETNLKESLKKDLFSVRKIDFDELMKKSGIAKEENLHVKQGNANNSIRRETERTIEPPKKKGPVM